MRNSPLVGTSSLFFTALLLGLVGVFGYAQAPVPLINLPLVPDAVAPGGPDFTLTINGTGFVSDSVVNWNGSARATTFVNESQLTAAIPASDIATASTASVTVVNPVPGGTSNVVYFPVTAPAASVSLARTEYSAPVDNNQMVTADFNRDGILDLASSDWGSSSVAVWLGRGDGTFGGYWRTSVCGAHHLAVGDFNADGIADLAVASRGCGQVVVLLGNGDGTFRQSQSISTRGTPYSVTVGDFNSDGKLDLAAPNEWGQGVSVLLGNGDGTFQPPIECNVGGNPHTVATGGSIWLWLLGTIRFRY